MIKEKGKPDHWYDYIVSRYDIVGKNDQKLLDLIEEFKTLSKRTGKINDISKFITIGGEEYEIIPDSRRSFLQFQIKIILGQLSCMKW